MTAASNPREELEFIYSVLAAHVDVEGELHPDLGLADLDLDSLGIMTLVVEVEDHFLVALDETDEAGLLTIGDIALAIHRHRQDSFVEHSVPISPESNGADR
jgi:acyl carrier protein